MAISAVNSVSFRNNYNNIQFEGKRKQDKGGEHHRMSSPMKAVPLAVLIAMSPLNTVQAQNNTFDSKVIQSAIVKVATPPDYKGETRPCEIQYISTDNNDEDIERISLMFTEPMFTRKSINGKLTDLYYDYRVGVNADTLEVCNVITEYSSGRSVSEKRYYVSGEGSILRTGYYTDKGDYINKDGYFEKKKVRYEISKDLYDHIEACMEDEIQYKNTSKVVDGDKRAEENLLFWE